MLEMLALRAGRPVPAELLYEGLWGETHPPRRPRPCRPIFPTCAGRSPRAA